MATQYGRYSLPATAICPGCGSMVTLPAEPIYPDTPPAICGTCGIEVPDYRRDSFIPEPELKPIVKSAAPDPEPEVAPENRRYSRGGLFKSLGGILAERGADAIDQAKDRFNGAG